MITNNLTIHKDLFIKIFPLASFFFVSLRNILSKKYLIRKMANKSSFFKYSLTNNSTYYIILSKVSYMKIEKFKKDKNMLLKQCIDRIEYTRKKKAGGNKRWGDPEPIELDVHLRV